MDKPLLKLDVDAFVTSLLSWNDAENVGSIIRSLSESCSEWDGKSKLKRLRKFINKYCPDVINNTELMVGITENWRFEDIIWLLKKQGYHGKPMMDKLKAFISNELVDVSSSESKKQILAMKRKFSMEDLKDIVILMMMAESARDGWLFVSSLAQSWTEDKLQELVKMILSDEEYDDIGHGSDGGLFNIFPYLEGHVSIRKVLDQEDDDTEGSLVDFIEDDLGERKDKHNKHREEDNDDDEEDEEEFEDEDESESESDDSKEEEEEDNDQEEDNEEEEDEEDEEEEEGDNEEEEFEDFEDFEDNEHDLESEDDCVCIEDEEKRGKRERKVNNKENPPKRRKVIVISSDSD